MTKIESRKASVAAKTEDVYNFLCDMNNIKFLLPEDKISDWKSDDKSCSFKVQGAYQITLNFHSAEPHSQIKYVSGAGSPFSFTLTTFLKDNQTNTEGHMLCEANINPFLEMMVKGPLKNLFDYMADKLGQRFSTSA